MSSLDGNSVGDFECSRAPRNKTKIVANKMVQWVEAPAAKPKDLSLIPGSHILGGENQFLQIFSDFHLTHTYIQHGYAHTQKKKDVIKIK